MIVLLTFRYDTYPWECGDYDHDDFKANEMCCACGGGRRARYSAKPDYICPNSVDPTEESCLMAFSTELTKFCEDSTGGAFDLFGDGCEWSLRGV